MNDIEKIKDNGFQWQMPAEALQIIKKLSDTIGAVAYSPTPVFPKKEKREEIVFNKPVKAERPSDVKLMNEITSLLNKLTSKNYENLKESIIDKISLLIDLHVSETNITNLILDIASTNKFYSHIYATLYWELTQKWGCFYDILNEHYKVYQEQFKTIQTCDPVKEYDLFCKITKDNDKRRSFTMFIVNLTKRSVFEPTKLVDLLEHFYQTLEQLIHQENQKHIVEEIIEHVFLIMKDCRNEFNLSTDCIVRLSQTDVKSTKSLSHKIVFRCMDILELKN